MKAKCEKTERLMHRDKPERLLACLEGIDDDLIAEAAQAVNYGKLKSPVWKWFSPGSAAAVFIGAIAVTCVLMLAFWISTAGPSGVEVPGQNGESGGYSSPAPLPSPMPSHRLEPGGILPVPNIQASAFEVILPAGQQHMTVNNPWHDIGHMSELPVFRNHAVTHIAPPVWSSQAWAPSTENAMTSEEWDEFVDMIHAKGQAIAIAARIAPDRISPEPEISNLFVATIIDGYRSIASHQIGTLSLNTHLSPVYGETIRLPQGASVAINATGQEVQTAIESIVEQLSDVIPMEMPRPTNAQGMVDIGGQRTYHRQRFFDAGGTPEDAILSFNFRWVEVWTFDPHSPERIEIALFPHEHFESLQLGHYPIITADEARELLLEGYFISNYPDSQWPGRERALEASVELVYYSPIFSEVEVIMPFYRFLVEIEMPLWGRGETQDAGAYRAFARYYVPAIHRDYLEPMTRRSITEPPEPPTGPRALPPNIFSLMHGREWHHIPVQISRNDVTELWDEVMSDIGELAIGEAYQFRTACGLYALITGNRLFSTRDELHRYFPGYDWVWDGNRNIGTPRVPGFDLPEAVGDFSLREISVFDHTRDMMFLFYRPIAPFGHLFAFGGDNPGPVGEIFTREPAVHSIFAMYENSEGVQVGLGITLPIMGLNFMSDEPHTALDMGDYGQIFFQGHPGRYYRALHEAIDDSDGWWWSVTMELWFVNGSIDGRQLTWDLGYGPWHGNPHGCSGTHWFTPVEREALEELVRIFNPAAMFAEYKWQLMSLQ